MKHILLLLIPFLAATAFGCLSNEPEGQPGVVEVEGTYVHKGSKIEFPTSVGLYERTGVNQYDTAGKDVSAGYNLYSPLAPIAITVYVYPAPGVLSIGSPPNVVAAAKDLVLRDHFEAVKQEITKVHPIAQLISEENVPIQQSGATYQGIKAAFQFTEVVTERSIDLTSLVFLYDYDDWYIKYRVTYPTLAKANSEPEVEQFVRQFVW